MRPDGIPDTPVTAVGYGYFNPSGSFLAEGIPGPGGATIKIGALMGTFLAAPTGPSDYFLIGYGTTITLASITSVFGQVNDTYYPNDGGAFLVDVSLRETSGAVPEPASWALMLAGFGLMGAAMRRANGQRRTNLRVKFA